MPRSPLVVVLALLAAFVVTPPAAASGPLRVLTANIHHGEGPDGRVDLDRLTGELAAAGADVIGLQEVDRHYGPRSGWRDEAGELGARLGLREVFSAHLDEAPPGPGSPRRQYGTAVLTRLPVLSAVTIPLPGPPATERRGLQEVVLAGPAGPLRVLVTHLCADDAAVRRAQARAVAVRVARSPEPVLLLGDLNAPPDATEVRTLTARLADAGGGPTFPADDPVTRIDYVLTGGRVLDVAVLPTASSDHRALAASVLVEQRGHRWAPPLLDALAHASSRAG